MQQAFDLSIVLPMYQPKHGWQHQLLSNIQDVKNHLPLNLSVQFIIVNDGNENDHLLCLFDVIQQSYPFIFFAAIKRIKEKVML